MNIGEHFLRFCRILCNYSRILNLLELENNYILYCTKLRLRNNSSTLLVKQVIKKFFPLLSPFTVQYKHKMMMGLVTPYDQIREYLHIILYYLKSLDEGTLKQVIKRSFLFSLLSHYRKSKTANLRSIEYLVIRKDLWNIFYFHFPEIRSIITMKQHLIESEFL